MAEGIASKLAQIRLNASVNENQIVNFQEPWVLWKMLPQDYDPSLDWSDRLSPRGRVVSVPDCWRLYNEAYSQENLTRIVSKNDFYLFKEGIKPENKIAPNTNGGRWRIVLKRNEVTRFHHILHKLLDMLATSGFDEGLEGLICGVMATIGWKSYDNVAIYVWVREIDQSSWLAFRNALEQNLNVTWADELHYGRHNKPDDKKNVSQRTFTRNKNSRN
ncbi:eukaryotic initiation factor 4E domain-containing protein [Ditylenchus destructor]|uniref:Eukaryotic initiation factor 4E domain-containing protein n=1 Tax=Ditylenchus destructor TaxID=166010 RepID=A0AAD4R3G0_9BILA|nr:eukaryotic initiation factor 4E domain-containing protein [Ditylenchus destructor]